MIPKKSKIGSVAGLFVITCLLVYYFHSVLKIGTIISHLFYIPIILACIWWKRKGLIVAIFSSAFLIFSHILFRPDVTPINDYARAIMFVVIAIVIVLLREHAARVENKFKDTEKRLQILFEFDPDAYFLYDLEGAVVDVNEAAKEIIGYEKHELIGKKFSELKALPQSQIQKVKQILVEYTLGKQVKPHELVLNHKNGKQITVEIRTYPVKIKDRTLLLGIARDITERKEAEEKLKEAYKIINKSPVVVFLWQNKEGWPVEFVSENVKELFGYTDKEFMTGMIPYDKVIHPEDLDRVAKEASRYSREKGREGYKHKPYRIVTKNGEVKWVDDITEIRRNAEGIITHYQGIVIDITKRKKAEERIINSEHKFKSIFENANDAIFLMDEDTFIDCNLKTEDIFGCKREEILHHTPYEFSPPRQPDGSDSKEKALKKIRAVLNGNPQLFEWKHQKLDGTLFDSEVSLNRIKVENKVMVQAIVRDITSRKQMEEELKSEKEKVRKYLDIAGVLIVAINTKGEIILINKTGCKVLGYKEKEIIGKNWFDNFIPERMREKLKSVSKKLLTGEIENVEYYENPILTKSGEERMIAWHNTVIKDKKGNIVGHLSSGEDITERKKAEEKLKISERRYQELFNSVIEGIGLVDENEVIQICNPAFAKIFDEDSPDDMVGKSLLDYTHNRQKDLVLSQTAKRKKGISTKYELEIITAKGKRKIINASISPRFDDKNNYIGAFGSIIDITEKKSLQESALRAQRLEEAGRVAGQVAHDFNNLLAPLMAYPEIIREELPENHPVLQYIEEIERSAEQITEINQQLLTLGRRGHYSLEPLNLNDIITNVIKHIHMVPETLTIETDLSDNLMNIKGGSSQIFRVILNLVHNARDAMMDVGHLTIKTENYYVDKLSGKFGRVPRGEYVRLTVSDTGSGIPDDIMPKILDPFFTTKTTTKKRGSGLGLSIVHAVVEDHNGYIDVESKVGEGTKFYLYFPITRESLEEKVPEQIVGGTENILVVDDDNVQREVASKLLKKLGYKVSTVESGEKAIDFIKKNPQDILLLDMIMPDGIDGAETYKKVLKFNPSQKAIIISGYKETEKVEEALKLGAGAFIRKPLTLKTIAQALRKELDKKETINNVVSYK